MQNRAKEVKTNSVSLNGLEEVFDVDTTVIGEVDQADNRVSNQAESKGLTIRQASQHYGFAVPTIRLKIKVGEIPAVKLNGPKGPEWRIFPNGVPDGLQDTDISVHTALEQGDSTEVEELYKADKTLAEGFHQANINVASLIKANQDMMAKLEMATYRNGYLEAQLEAERNQVKLLTDSLHKVQSPATEEQQPSTDDLGWWTKFCSWFKST